MAELLTLKAHGRDAQLLMEYPAFRRTFDAMYQTAMDTFQNSAPDQTAVREEAYWTMRTLRAFEQALVGATKAPDLETRRLDRQR